MNELVDIEKADENDEESGGGGDATVLPKVVVKVLTPLLEAIIISMYDPLSASSSQNIHSTLTELLDYDPTQEELSPILQALGMNTFIYIYIYIYALYICVCTRVLYKFTINIKIITGYNDLYILLSIPYRTHSISY